MTKLIFDSEHYERLNTARSEALRRVLSELRGLHFKTALDLGCGVGFFSGALSSLGLQVTALDGRRQNVDEASRRFPTVHFDFADAQDPGLPKWGQFDLVICFGFLYHLESPFATVRSLRTMTNRLLLIEAVIFPGDEPIMALVDENPFDDQGLNHVAFYPTEACLIKMLYKAGFEFVYRFAEQPAHPDYHISKRARRIRTMLAASRELIESKLLSRAEEASTGITPWNSAVTPHGFTWRYFAERFAKRSGR